jgi:tetratricopeptide (TPR) repeat protein
VTRPRPIVAVLAVVVLVGGVGYAVWRQARPKPPAPPTVELGDVDPQVVRAIENARAAVTAEPVSSAAWGKLGTVLFAHDFNAEALACFAEAERLDDKDLRWPYYQGVLLAAERPAEAIAPLQRAAQRAGREPLPRLRLAETLYALDRLDEAEAQLRKAPDSAEVGARVQLDAGLIAWRRGDWKGCVGLLERVAPNPLARHAAGVALADAYEHLGNVAAATHWQPVAASGAKPPPWPDRLLEQITDVQVGTRGRLNRVNTLLNANDVAKAVDLCRQMVRDDPNSDMAQLALGRALMQAHDYAAADEVLAEAARRWPRSIDASLMRGGALQAVGKYGDAADCYRKVIELSPSHGLAHYNLAVCLRRTGDRPGARKSLADAIRCRPDLEPAHVDLGELLLDDGDPAAAAIHLRDALRLNPDDERAKKLLADAEAKSRAK